MVPLSFNITLSPDATIVFVALVSPSSIFNSAALAVTSIPPNLRPFVPSWEAISRSFVPSDNVKLPSTVKPVSVPTDVIPDWSASTLRTCVFDNVKPVPATPDFNCKPVAFSIALYVANWTALPATLPEVEIVANLLSAIPAVVEIWVLSIPSALTLNVVPTKLNVLLSAVKLPALENCVNVSGVVSNVMLSVVHTKPLSALAVPCSTNTKALLSSTAVFASVTLVHEPPSTTT